MGQSSTELQMHWLTSWINITPNSFRNLIDISAVLMLVYIMLLIIGERRTLWMLRGFIVLMLATVMSEWLRLELLNFVLRNLVIGAAVAMSVILQTEFRRFLEQLGRGEILQLLRPTHRTQARSNSFTDEIVDAIKELSQKRIGALMILEVNEYIDERDFSVPGVQLNAEVSKELLQTIFQTSTPLHDGAVLIRDARVVAAGVILPLSERPASRQLGTRHRAAMGITERVDHCICIVVSEETGSISVAENGVLNRPLTSSKLKEILEEKFAQRSDREINKPSVRGFLRQVRTKSYKLISHWRRPKNPS
jgi:uncharacterized protein (TIGR00159 family)